MQIISGQRIHKNSWAILLVLISFNFLYEIKGVKLIYPPPPSPLPPPSEPLNMIVFFGIHKCMCHQLKSLLDSNDLFIHY